MTEVVQKELQHQLIRWGIMSIITLVGAGLVSIANRNVYSKEAVDHKFLEVERARNYELRIITTKLDNLAEDVQEVKASVDQHVESDR